MTENITIRDAQATDLEVVLKLNEAFVHFLSPLDLAGLAALGAEAAYFRVVELEGNVAAFLIAYTPGSDYQSDNYQWFDSRYDDFAYIDRIVVAARAQGKALGVKLYDDLAEFAQEQGLAKLTCEYNIQPMNEGSARFHERYGFKEIGQQELAGGQKRVSLQAFAIGANQSE